MKRIWNKKFEILIGVMGFLLIINFFFPSLMPLGLHTCLLWLFIISVILLKLFNISSTTRKYAKEEFYENYFKSRNY